MTPHPRIQKTLRWAGAAVTMLLLVLWIGSGWIGTTLATTKTSFVAVWTGQVYVAIGDVPLPMSAGDMEWGRTKRYTLYWYGFARPLVNGGLICVPLWPLIAVAACSMYLSWRPELLRWLRSRRGHCPGCNYDRAGLPPAALCPECAFQPAKPVPCASPGAQTDRVPRTQRNL
jgi:hypothetical protein